jgi:hypothetical protein
VLNDEQVLEAPPEQEGIPSCVPTELPTCDVSVAERCIPDGSREMLSTTEFPNPCDEPKVLTTAELLVQSLTKEELAAQVVKLRAQVQQLLGTETRHNKMVDPQQSTKADESVVSLTAAGKSWVSAAAADMKSREWCCSWTKVTDAGNEWMNAASVDMAKREWLYSFAQWETGLQETWESPELKARYYRRGVLSRASQVVLYKSELQDALGAEPSYDHPLDGEPTVNWARSIDRHVRSSHGTVTEWNPNRNLSGKITPTTGGDVLDFHGSSFVGDTNDLAVGLQVRYCTQADMPGMVHGRAMQSPEAISITIASGQQRPSQPAPSNAGRQFDDMMSQQKQRSASTVPERQCPVQRWMAPMREERDVFERELAAKKAKVQDAIDDALVRRAVKLVEQRLIEHLYTKAEAQAAEQEVARLAAERAAELERLVRRARARAALRLWQINSDAAMIAARCRKNYHTQLVRRALALWRMNARELKDIRVEAARLAEEARLAEQARLAEEARLVEEARLAEEAHRRAEELRRQDELATMIAARLMREVVDWLVDAGINAAAAEEEARLERERAKEQARKQGLHKMLAAKDAILLARDRRTPEEIAAARALWEKQQMVARALEHARLAKQAADDELLKLDKNKIAQLKGYKVPPTAVHGVFQAVLLLKGGATRDAVDWSTSRKHVDLGFLHSLRQFDIEAAMHDKKLGKKRVQGIRTLLQKTGGEQAAERASIVALVLFKWVVACLEIYEALVQFAALQKEMESHSKAKGDKTRTDVELGAVEQAEFEHAEVEDHGVEHLVAEHYAKEAAARKIQGAHRARAPRVEDP